MAWLVSSSLRFRVLVVAGAVALMIWGIRIVRTTAFDVFPEFALPTVEVQTEAPGLSTEEVESLVTLPLENALNGTSGLKTIRSKSVLGLSSVVLLFEEGTERAFTSPLNDEKRDGTFICAACNLPLFEATTKYDSHTGWPSFKAAIPGHLGTKTDFKIGFPRTEYHCARCGGHQGHIFDDGPPPAGKRYCNNGVALLFVPAGEELPELRP